MKQLSKALAGIVTTLSPTMVLAHSGHMAHEGMHGMLHGEHILLLVAVAALVFFVLSRNK